MKQSAGILPYKVTNGIPMFFIVHPGGPYWISKDSGAWSVAKGEIENEDPLDAAIREFREETGQTAQGSFIALSAVRQKSGKNIWVWATEMEFDAASITCNTFSIEWPPRSGTMQSFPEIDRAGWFTAEQAKTKLNPAQAPLIDELVSKLGLGES